MHERWSATQTIHHFIFRAVRYEVLLSNTSVSTALHGTTLRKENRIDATELESHMNHRNFKEEHNKFQGSRDQSPLAQIGNEEDRCGRQKTHDQGFAQEKPRMVLYICAIVHNHRTDKEDEKAEGYTQINRIFNKIKDFFRKIHIPIRIMEYMHWRLGGYYAPLNHVV